jgi:sulfatase modifying factor 1
MRQTDSLVLRLAVERVSIQPMRTRTAFFFVAALCAAFALLCNLHAQPLVNIETVTVGDAGNSADTTGYGAVNYEFNIGKYETTIAQYTVFLNAVARRPSEFYVLDLWSPGMTEPWVAGISRSGSGTLGDPYTYAVIGSGNRPITYVSWNDAARFANWVHNGATNGASTETGAYTLNGSTNRFIPRNPDATWWLPDQNEWYKSAYYKGSGTDGGYWLYPTQSDTAPTAGSPSANTNSANYNYVVGLITEVGAYVNSAGTYGTYDQAGNVWEWTDPTNDAINAFRRGGGWPNPGYEMESTIPSWSISDDVSREGYNTGFRMATAIPEPSTYALLLMTGAGALWWTRRKLSK